MIHSRTEWAARPTAPGRPLTLFRPGAVKGVVIHWDGSPIDRRRDPAEVVRSTQSFHMGPHHLWRDIAYNLAVDWDGGIWEGRGLHHQGGATDNDEANATWVNIELLFGVGQTMTPQMVRGMSEAIAVVRATHPGADGVTPHSRWTATQCPGDEVRAAITLGRFEPPPSPNVPQLPLLEDEPMTPEDRQWITDQLATLRADIKAEVVLRARNTNGAPMTSTADGTVVVGGIDRDGPWLVPVANPDVLAALVKGRIVEPNTVDRAKLTDGERNAIDGFAP